MLTIGLCDDDLNFIEELHTFLHNYMKNVSDWQPRIYHSGDEILADISHHTFDCNLLFIDIIMPGTNGIEIAKYIYEHHIDTDIIFTTSSKEHIYECYRYHSFSYLLKPLSVTTAENELNRYFSEIAKAPKCLNISIKNVHHRIPLRSILYLESDCRKVIIHTPSRDYEYYQRLDHLEAILKDSGFVRCHKSYLIPESRLTSYQSGKVMIGDIEIPVSNRYKGDMEQLFSDTVSSASVLPDGCQVTRSLSQNRGITGALVCTKGAYLGSIIRFFADCEITLGRDGTACDVVINLAQISRKHCSILYHSESNTYEITDYSHNGTFLTDEERMTKNKPYHLKPGTAISFGNADTVYRLI
ncbi:MAG: LytTR family transcriptional regulator DNA-binding domain-containing protein [Lachnospiraceae bacterium]|nr:LytTR family transcriptional regulator DNA-binding domain-containing protein [Lachnospiraceae bacterium]